MNTETRGERARRLLDDEVLRQARKDARERLKERIATSQKREEREALWHKLQAVDELLVQLRVYAGEEAKIKHDRRKDQQRETTQ